MDVDTQLYQDVGALKSDVGNIKADVANMDAKLDRVIAHIEREKGTKRAWGTITGIGGTIAGAIGGAVVSWLLGSKP